MRSAQLSLAKKSHMRASWTALANNPGHLKFILSNTEHTICFHPTPALYPVFFLIQKNQLPNSETWEKILSDNSSTGFLPLNLDLY